MRDQGKPLHDPDRRDVGHGQEERDVAEPHEDEAESEQDEAGRAAPGEAADPRRERGAAEVVP